MDEGRYGGCGWRKISNAVASGRKSWLETSQSESNERKVTAVKAPVRISRPLKTTPMALRICSARRMYVCQRRKYMCRMIAMTVMRMKRMTGPFCCVLLPREPGHETEEAKCRVA